MCEKTVWQEGAAACPRNAQDARDTWDTQHKAYNIEQRLGTAMGDAHFPGYQFSEQF